MKMLLFYKSDLIFVRIRPSLSNKMKHFKRRTNIKPKNVILKSVFCVVGKGHAVFTGLQGRENKAQFIDRTTDWGHQIL